MSSAAQTVAGLEKTVAEWFSVINDQLDQIDTRLEDLADDIHTLRRSIDLEAAHTLRDGEGI